MIFGRLFQALKPRFSVKGITLHLTIIALVILGRIGLPTILDVFSLSAMRWRRAAPWRNWRLLSRVTIYTSAALLAFGTVVFFLMEYYNTLSSLGFAEALVTAFFQSATTRSSGFNTVDISALNVPTLLLFLVLMFIGGSPGSMGGGIKTTTFTIIILSVVTTLRGRENVEIANRTIPHSLSYKAFSVFTFAVVMNIIFIFLLSITDAQFDILKLMFEQISAFATVGLSTGITAGNDCSCLSRCPKKRPFSGKSLSIYIRTRHRAFHAYKPALDGYCP